MLKKLQVALILVLLIIVGIVYHNLRMIEQNTPLAASAPVGVPNSNSAAPAALTPAPAATRKTAKDGFEAMVNEEAATISQLNDHPEEVQKRLKDLAEKMQEADVPKLQENALNPNLNGDQRFLSVYILGESSLPKAQESLEAIATTPIPKMHEERALTQEEIIRGQAVESIRQVEVLKRVAARSDNGFINDRAQRNILYLEGKASSPDQQDREALTQLLKKSH